MGPFRLISLRDLRVPGELCPGETLPHWLMGSGGTGRLAW